MSFLRQYIREFNFLTMRVIRCQQLVFLVYDLVTIHRFDETPKRIDGNLITSPPDRILYLGLFTFILSYMQSITCPDADEFTLTHTHTCIQTHAHTHTRIHACLVTLVCCVPGQLEGVRQRLFQMQCIHQQGHTQHPKLLAMGRNIAEWLVRKKRKSPGLDPKVVLDETTSAKLVAPLCRFIYL